MTEGVYDKRKLKTCQSTWGHNRLSHVLEKNEVPDTLNGFLVKYEDATIIIPDSTLLVFNPMSFMVYLNPSFDKCLHNALPRSGDGGFRH